MPSAQLEPQPQEVVPAVTNPQPITDDQQSATNNRQLTTDNLQLTVAPPQPAETAQQPPEPARPHPRSFLARAFEKIQFRKRARQEKIVALAVKKRSIANDDVEKLLRVSDATATRYLAELVRQGRLKRSGATRGTRFEPR